MNIRPMPLGLLALALIAAPVPANAQAVELAVVVHPKVPVGNLSLAELRRLFRGERQFWGDNSRVVLFVPAPGMSERATMLGSIFNMSEGQYRQYWIGKIFRAEVATGPRTIASVEQALSLVASTPGAIVLVPAGAVDGSVKTVRVDGKAPGQAGYPLR